MTLSTINPRDAKRLLDQGAIPVDICEANEHARDRIPAAQHLPLSKLDDAEIALHEGTPVIFHCRSGARAFADRRPRRHRPVARAGCEPQRSLSPRPGS